MVLATLAVTVMLSSVGTSIANVAVPSFALAFDAGIGEVQWVVLAYLLAATCVVVTVGALGDLVGRGRLLRWGLLLFTVARCCARLHRT